jgi:hypothetical protein
MSCSRNGTRSLARVACALCAAVPLAPVSAQTAAPSPDAWQFRAILYGWFPSVDGSSSFPPPNGRDIEVSTDKILDSLNFAFMASLEAQRGRWGAFTDVIYMDFGATKNGTRDFEVGRAQIPAGIDANLTLDLKGWAWTVAGSYRAIMTPDLTTDVFVGARLLDIKERLGYEFSANFDEFSGPGRNGSSEQKVHNWDAIIGARGRVSFGPSRQWFVPYYIDVGTGDSDVTWQGLVGLGYAFNWGELVAAYRFLDYDFKSGDRLNDLRFSGPAVGVAFRW